MPAPSPGYESRPAYAGPLANLVRRHLPEFEERVAEQADRKVPGYVIDQLRALSQCGDFTRGFVHFKCGKCDKDRVFPFVCRSKLCPSCSGRTMAERAAWLVDRVLYGEARWRQYVITFPAPLAVGLCFREALAKAVTRVCMRVLFEYQKARADPHAQGTPRPGAVVWVQRFSDGAGSWLHLHVLAPDGVFRQLPDSLDVPFEPQPPPNSQEVTDLVRTIATRVDGLLRRRAPAAPDDPLLERCGVKRTGDTSVASGALGRRRGSILAALIPRPKTNSVLYFGCLSAASPIYRAVVPAPPDPTPTHPVAPPRPAVMPHAHLLLRVFLIDVLACPCGGRLRVVQTVTDPDVVQAILAGIILSNQAPPRAPPAARVACPP